MEKLKFGALEKDLDPSNVLATDYIPHIYAKVFEKLDGRMIVGLPSGHVDLWLKLASALTSPFLILYVLVVPRGVEPGRYQLTRSLNLDELNQFTNRYHKFFEQDGRHNIWVHSPADQATIIYDRHQVLWLYGKEELFKQILLAEGFIAGTVEIPTPHFHNYKDEFDADQNSIVSWREFVRTPLKESDTY
jgi:hypothetical protein